MKKIYMPKEYQDDESFKFYFNENGEARRLIFHDDHGHEVDDTCYIEGSNEIYLNGLYFNMADCVEV